MTRKVVSKLRAEDVPETDAEVIEASVWCEQRQALRYTVVCRADSYTDDVLAVLGKLQEPALGFEREFVCKFIGNPMLVCQSPTRPLTAGFLAQTITGSIRSRTMQFELGCGLPTLRVGAFWSFTHKNLSTCLRLG
jgi:hypothetical protein